MPVKLTHEEFIKKLYINNSHDITVLGQYVNSHTPIRVKCNTHNVEYDQVPAELLRGKGCRMCGVEKSAASRRMTNSEFIDKLKLLDNNITALDEYTKYETKIRFQCMHGHIWSAIPNSVLNGSGCPYCSGNSVLIGFNDLWTTRPDVARMLENPEYGYKHSKGSNASVAFVCPQCGNVAEKPIIDVCNQGLGCQICSDGISYPNKFIRQVLTQLKIDFIPEYNPDWAKPRRYDCYFEYCGNKYIVEMDGRQHFYNAFSQEVLEETKSNDEFKTSLATQNGIDVIRIDCIKSDCDYIKDNILSSKLNNILDFSNINWDLCDKSARKSLVKEVCELYMSGMTNLNDICNLSHLCICTVRNYLKIGSRCGLCNYDPQEASVQSYRRKSIPVILIDDIGNIMYNFNSLNDCVKQMRKIFNVILDTESVKQHCKTHQPYKGFNFRFANETIQN